MFVFFEPLDSHGKLPERETRAAWKKGQELVSILDMMICDMRRRMLGLDIVHHCT